MNNNIELKDVDYPRVNTSKAARKIKLKPVSFIMISNAWKQHKLKRLEKQLDKAKQSLISIKPSQNDYNRITNRAYKVARLEAQIRFLNVPGSKAIGISNRAIKIRNNVMENIQYSMNGRYEIPKDKINEVFNTNQEKTGNIQDINNKSQDETKITNDSVNKNNSTLPEKQIISTNSTDQTIVSPIMSPNRDDIKETVDRIFREQENTTVNKDDISKTIETSMENVEPIKEIPQTDIESAIDDEMSNVKVSKNKSTVAKIDPYKYIDKNPYIQEDGTYRMTKEEIIDGLTHIDTSQLNYKPKINNGADSSINLNDTKEPDVSNKDNLSSDTGLNDDIFGTNNDLINAKAAEKVEQGQLRDTPIITPERKTNEINKFEFIQKDEEKTEKVDQEQNIHFDYSDASVQDLTKAVDNAHSIDDINALRDRVAQLKAEKEASEQAVEEAKASAEKTEERFQQTVQQFRTYAETLAESCESNRKSAAAQLERKKQREAEINEMLEAMGNSSINTANTKKGK